MRCVECETIDQYVFDTTCFWFYPPTVDCRGKLKSFFKKKCYQTGTFGPLGLTVSVERPQLDGFLTSLYGLLNGQELATTKVLTTGGRQPELADMAQVISTDIYIDRFKSEWLIEALDAGRYQTWFQPIFSASGKLFAHEGLFRLSDKDQNMIPPAHVFDLAARTDLLFTVDLIARRSAVEHAARGGLSGKIFINFNPSSIYDPSYCLRTTAAAIEELGIKASDVVFEITETHQATDMDHLKGILAFYKQAGFGVALDDIGSGFSGLNMLHETRPDYVKIDMDLIRDINTDSYKQVIVANLIETAVSLGIRTIVEGIETESEAAWVKASGADFMQGYLFGKPQPIA